MSTFTPRFRRVSPLEPIITEYVYPPILDRQFDWAAYRHPKDRYIGRGRTEADAIADLLELEENA